MEIKDGTGKGFKAKVNATNKLETQAVSTSELHEISHAHGKAFMMHTAGFVDITTLNTETGVFHLINDANNDLFIHSIRTCGDQVQKIKLYKAVTTGTLLSNAVAGGQGNLNQTSNNSPNVTVYKGVNGDTITDGMLAGQHINGIGHSAEQFDGAMILGSGDSITVTCELAVSGSMCVRVIAYRDSF